MSLKMEFWCFHSPQLLSSYPVNSNSWRLWWLNIFIIKLLRLPLWPLICQRIAPGRCSCTTRPSLCTSSSYRCLHSPAIYLSVCHSDSHSRPSDWLQSPYLHALSQRRDAQKEIGRHSNLFTFQCQRGKLCKPILCRMHLWRNHWMITMYVEHPWQFILVQ